MQKLNWKIGEVSGITPGPPLPSYFSRRIVTRIQITSAVTTTKIARSMKRGPWDSNSVWFFRVKAKNALPNTKGNLWKLKKIVWTSQRFLVPRIFTENISRRPEIRLNVQTPAIEMKIETVFFRQRVYPCRRNKTVKF